ncbi:MAG: hypothetical protein ACRDS0_10340 [Pseudonocardiaceae bacterium]
MTRLAARRLTKGEREGLIGFIAQWHLPDVTWGPATQNGSAAIHLWAPDGSRASIGCTPAPDGFPVSQRGPQHLWTQFEEAHSFWHSAGRPSYDQFGITATATDQHVWYDHPDSEHSWPLPIPTTAVPEHPPATQANLQ